MVLETKADASGAVIHLPAGSPDPIATVIVLDVEGVPAVTPESRKPAE